MFGDVCSPLYRQKQKEEQQIPDFTIRVLRFSSGNIVLRLSLTQLESRLRDVSRCQPVGFTVIVTPSRIRKTGHALAGKIRKVSIGSGMVNCQYEAGVNRQRLREGLPADFCAGPPSVGERIPGTPMCESVTVKGTTVLYLELFVQQTKSHYFCTDDKRELSYFEEVKPFEYAKKPVPVFASQGTKKLIRPLTYRLDSVAELRIGGTSWSVRPLDDELNSYLLSEPAA